MKIASLVLDNPFILAPLAGYTDLPFRLLCREMGAGLVISEMISCHGLIYGQEKNSDHAQNRSGRTPPGLSSSSATNLNSWGRGSRSCLGETD